MPHARSPWPVRLARQARRWHKWTGTLLSLVMVVLAVSGTLIAFKKEWDYLQPAARQGEPVPITAVIPPAQVAKIVLALDLPEAQQLEAINRIELRPGKQLYKVRLESSGTFSSPREIQVDAGTGAVLNTGLRGDQLWMDIHSFAVFGQGTKLVLMTLAGISLLWLSLSGLYLFGFPPWHRARKRRRRTR
ncbi:MAG TPA: PepSY-associated TM helix domain-containing protein [Pseudohaliea sp.]|nr:PepSY-associated TM helix domain-containing protein [Pseudohaliea sp.]